MKPGVEPSLALIHEALAAYEPRQEQLLPILHDVQERCGWIPREAIPLIAARLNLSRAEVHGVVTFYRDLRQTPPGRHVVQICVAEACQAVGCRTLTAHAQRTLTIPFGGTTADGRVTLEQAHCFGNCACGPTVRIGDRVHGRVTPARFDDLLSHLEPAP